MFSTQKIDKLAEGQCLVDQTFVFTEPINQFLRNHIDFKNKYIIYASFLMDMMIITFVALFYLYWKSYRIVIAYVLFFGLRTFVQVRLSVLTKIENLFHGKT